MTDATKDNPPAFPRNYRSDGHNGMNMRDYFAAKAMQGELAAMSETATELCGVSLNASDKTLARLAQHYYRMADSMLAERAK